jgi:hypothetical protein
MLGVADPLSYRVSGNDLEITLPALNPDTLPCRFAYTIKLPGGEVSAEK